MVLYFSKVPEGDTLCVFPDTSTWMFVSEQQFQDIKSRFGTRLELREIAASFDPTSKRMDHGSCRSIDDEIVSYFQQFSNGNERPSEKTLLRNPIVSLTNRCFLKCAYCYVSSPSFTKDQFRTLRYEYVASFIDNVLKSGGDEVFSIQYFGGEPTVHRQLPELIRYSRLKGLQVRISTNGVAASLRSERYAAAIKDEKVEWRISLDSVDRAVNDRSRGSGTFDAIMRNLEHLHGVGANVSLKPVLTKNNISGLEDYLEFAFAHGFKVTYGTLLPVGDAIRNGVKRDLNEFHVVRHLVEMFSRKPYLIPTIELSPLGWTLKTIFLRGAKALPRFTAYLHDDGNVYPMDGMIDPKFCLGTADSFDLAKLAKLAKLQSEHGLSSERCTKCFLSGFCYTGDYHELRTRDPTMKADFYACRDRRDIYMLLMRGATEFQNIAKIMLTSQYTH